MKILIVDDSKAMRMIVKRTLKQAGFGDATTTEAVNGREGLEAVRADPPDLVLCDWNMPEMTGIEMLQALRDEGIDVKFGFVTTEGTNEMRHAATSAGAAFVIVKPFTADSFASALGELL